MEDTNVQEFVGNLSTVIEQIQNTILDLGKITSDLKLRVDEQQEKLDQYSSRTDEVFDSINKFTQTISEQTDELRQNFSDLTDKHDVNTQQISEWIEKFKDTLESMNKTFSDLEEDYRNMVSSSEDRVKGYQKQIENSFDQWKNKSEQLSKDIDERVSEIEKKVSIELESAALIMSRNLEPTLHDLIQTISGTKKQLESTWIIILIIFVVAITISVFAVLISNGIIQFPW